MATPLALPNVSKDETEAAELMAAANVIALTSNDDVAFATGLIREVKEKRQALDNQRKSLLEPITEAQKRINNLFNPIIAKYETFERTLRQRIVGFEAAQRAAAQRALEAAAQAAKAEDHAAVVQAIEKHDEAADAAKVSGLAYRRTWVGEVVDPEKVPREFCSPDPAKIKAYVKAHGGSAEIPGVKVYEQTTMMVR